MGSDGEILFEKDISIFVRNRNILSANIYSGDWLDIISNEVQ